MPTRLVVASATAAALLLGCQSTAPDVSEATPTAGAEVGSPTERDLAADPSEAASEDLQTDAPTAPAEAAPADCDDTDGEAIDAVIGDQLAAFASGDFAAALGFATPGFQESFPLEEFEAMITQGFPVPASATGHEVLDCQVIGTAAAAVVMVTGEAGTQALQYGLLELADGWRIDGAVPLDGAAPDGAPTEVI